MKIYFCLFLVSVLISLSMQAEVATGGATAGPSNGATAVVAAANSGSSNSGSTGSGSTDSSGSSGPTAEFKEKVEEGVDKAKSALEDLKKVFNKCN